MIVSFLSARRRNRTAIVMMLISYKEALLSRKRLHAWLLSGSKDIRRYVLSFVTDREWQCFLNSCSAYRGPCVVREVISASVASSKELVAAHKLLDIRYLDTHCQQKRRKTSSRYRNSKRQNKRRNQLSIAKRRDHKYELIPSYDDTIWEVYYTDMSDCVKSDHDRSLFPQYGYICRCEDE